MKNQDGMTNKGLNSRGIQVGVVKDNKDPEKMHRVLVTFQLKKQMVMLKVIAAVCDDSNGWKKSWACYIT